MRYFFLILATASFVVTSGCRDRGGGSAELEEMRGLIEEQQRTIEKLTAQSEIPTHQPGISSGGEVSGNGRKVITLDDGSQKFTQQEIDAAFKHITAQGFRWNLDELNRDWNVEKTEKLDENRGGLVHRYIRWTLSSKSEFGYSPVDGVVWEGCIVVFTKDGRPVTRTNRRSGSFSDEPFQVKLRTSTVQADDDLREIFELEIAEVLATTLSYGIDLDSINGALIRKP